MFLEHTELQDLLFRVTSTPNKVKNHGVGKKKHSCNSNHPWVKRKRNGIKKYKRT